MGEFRDPRGDRERMENVLSDKIEVIASRRERITEETYGVSGDFTIFRKLSQIYVDVVRLSYSLGASPEELREFIDPAVHWYIEYERSYTRVHQTPSAPVNLWKDSQASVIEAAQLLSLVVLLGTAEQRACLGEVVGWVGPQTVLEFLAGKYGDCLDGVELVMAQQRPYLQLLKVVQAEPGKRSKLMATFVKNWYAGCRKAYWFWVHEDSVKYQRPSWYVGYWCFEAAAVTQLLGIDDTLYRDNEYYPKDIFLTRD